MLPFRLAPAKQETLHSYVRRSAGANDLTAAVVLRGVDGVGTQDLCSRKKLPLTDIANVLGLEEGILEGMCPRQHRHACCFTPVRIPRDVTWTCPQCDRDDIQTFENITWLRFSCEEHGLLLTDSRPNRAPSAPVNPRWRARQSRINAALTGPTSSSLDDEIYRLTKLIRDMKTIATKVEIDSTPSDARKLLSWIKNTKIDTKYPARSPSHAAKVLDVFWAPVSMRCIHSKIHERLRSLDLPTLRRRNKPRDAETPETIGEIVRLFKLAWRIERIADENKLTPDDIPTMYLRPDDPDWLAQRRNRQFPEDAVEDYWQSRRQGCALVRTALIELAAQMKGSARQLTDYSDDPSLTPYDATWSNTMVQTRPHHFAADLAWMLINDDRTERTRTNLPTPTAQLKNCAAEKFAQPNGPTSLEEWLWLATLRDSCPYFYGPQASLTEILDLNDELTDIEKVTLLDAVANATPSIGDVLPHSARQPARSIEA